VAIEPKHPYRVCVRLTTLCYVDVEAIDAEHARDGAVFQTALACGVPSGTHIDPDSGKVSYPTASSSRPVNVRLESVECISVERREVRHPRRDG